MATQPVPSENPATNVRTSALANRLRCSWRFSDPINLVVNAMHPRGKVLVSDLRATVAARGWHRNRQRSLPMSAFGGNTDIPFQGRQDRF